MKLKNGAFIIGDPHGCLDSVMDLIQTAKVKIDNEQVVFVGDIIDKGPLTFQLMKTIERYGWLTVKGNHDDKLERLGRGNKVRMNPELEDTVRQLGKNWKTYAQRIADWPLYMPFEDEQGSGYIVHGGVGPDRPINEQSSNFLMRLRTWPFETYDRNKELENPPWQTVYKGHLGTIIHGHQPCDSVHFHGNKGVFSLDGGAVYATSRPWGGCMRGLRLGSRQVFEVPGRISNMKHYNSLS